MWIEKAKLDITSVIHTPSSQMSEASTQTWTMRSPRAADDDSRMICPSRCIFSRSVARSLGLLSRSYTVYICGIECRPGLVVLPHTDQGTPGRSEESMLGWEMICPVSGSNPVGAVAVFPLAHFQEMGLSDFHPQREFLMSISPLLILRCGKTEKSESVMIHAAGELNVGDADV